MLDHVGDALRVSAPVPNERLPARDIPTCSGVRARWPHRDVPLAVRALLPRDLGIGEVRLGI
jgi:hypothetical protein